MLTKYEKKQLTVKKHRREYMKKRRSRIAKLERLSIRLRDPAKWQAHFKVDPTAPRNVRCQLGYVKIIAPIASRLTADALRLGSMAVAVRIAIITYFLRHDLEFRSDEEARFKVKKGKITLPPIQLPCDIEIDTAKVKKALMWYYAAPHKIKIPSKKVPMKKHVIDPISLPQETLYRLMADEKYSAKKLSHIIEEFCFVRRK
jgi:hypothetical protein